MALGVEQDGHDGASGAVHVPTRRGRCHHHAHRPIKVLGTGDIKAKLTVKAEKFSGEAKKKIEAAGGKAELVAVLVPVNPHERTKALRAAAKAKAAGKKA